MILYVVLSYKIPINKHECVAVICNVKMFSWVILKGFLSKGWSNVCRTGL